jgi:Tfp pilus assembly protein PilO
MKNFIIALLFGVIIGGVGVWYYLEGREKSPVQKAEEQVKSTSETTKESVATAAQRLALETNGVHEVASSLQVKAQD